MGCPTISIPSPVKGEGIMRLLFFVSLVLFVVRKLRTFNQLKGHNL